MLTHGIAPDFRGGVHLFIFNRHTPSGHSRVYGSRNCIAMAFTAESLTAVSSVCVVFSFILDVRRVDAPAGVTQEVKFLHLPSAVLASIFTARRIQPPLSLVDCEVEFCAPMT